MDLYGQKNLCEKLRIDNRMAQINQALKEAYHTNNLDKAIELGNEFNNLSIKYSSFRHQPVKSKKKLNDSVN